MANPKYYSKEKKERDGKWIEKINELVDTVLYFLEEDEEGHTPPIRPYLKDIVRESDNCISITWKHFIPPFYIGLEFGDTIWWASDGKIIDKFTVLPHHISLNTAEIVFKPVEEGEKPIHSISDIKDILYKAPLLGFQELEREIGKNESYLYFKVPLSSLRAGLWIGMLSLKGKLTWSTTLMGDVLEIHIARTS